MTPYVFQRHMAELSTAEFVSTSGRKVLVCEALSCNGSVNARPEKEKKSKPFQFFLMLPQDLRHVARSHVFYSHSLFLT